MLHIVWSQTDCERVWSEGRDDYRPYLFEILNYLLENKSIVENMKVENINKAKNYT